MKSDIIIFSNLLNYIDVKRKKQLIILFFLMLVSAFLESLSLAAIIPFLGILDDSSNLDTFKFFNFNFSISNDSNLLLISVFVFLIAITISGFVRIYTIHISLKLSALIGNDLSAKTFKNILNLNYQDHLNLDNNKIIASLTEHLKKTQLVIDSLLTLIISSIISLSIFIFLIRVNLNALFLFTFIFGLSYFNINLINSKRVFTLSNRIVSKFNSQIKSVRETLLGIKDIKTNRLQKYYLNNHQAIDKSLKLAYSESSFLAKYPRFILEIIIIFTITIIAVSLKLFSNQTLNIFSILGGFAIASQRLLPLLQFGYSSFIRIKTNKPSLIEVLDILKMQIKEDFSKIDSRNLKSELFFKEDIALRNIHFSYKNSNSLALDNINLNIRKGERIGIIGRSGSGKSTLIDLLLGLLEPSAGQIFIDDNLLQDYINSYFKKNRSSPFSYVPQDFFIKEGTFLENIVYFVPHKDIDFAHLEKCAKIANIAEFIKSFPKNYYTFISENGKNLSGGQKQRLCIARALYNKPKILILDEATSALDKINSSEILAELNSFTSDITIIAITHDLSNLDIFTKIVEMEEGRIKSVYNPKNNY